MALRDWLPNVVDAAKPWMSTEDIEKGEAWFDTIRTSLESAEAGVIVLTPENIERPWVLFEAGAIYGSKARRPVCTLLCGLDRELVGPLGQFQSTKCTEADILGLVRTINKELTGDDLTKRVEARFRKFWPDLSEHLNTTIQSSTTAPTSGRRDSDLQVDEILSTVRTIQRDLKNRSLGTTHTTQLPEKPLSQEWCQSAGGTSYAGRFSNEAYLKLLGYYMLYKDETAAAYQSLAAYMDAPQYPVIKTDGKTTCGPFVFTIGPERVATKFRSRTEEFMYGIHVIDVNRVE